MKELETRKGETVNDKPIEHLTDEIWMSAKGKQSRLNKTIFLKRICFSIFSFRNLKVPHLLISDSLQSQRT